MATSITDTPFTKTNRQTAMTPVKHGAYWCCGCDANLVYAGKKCDNCGYKSHRKLLKKESNAK